ncbi:MAG: 50S ribosomal protein L25 [Phycisphaerales bacterium]|nr:50S ribosomal protein L25 [Phycisphaerales bacterium]
MSKTVTLAAEKRERTGSRYAQRARLAGKLPAVVYGHKEAPVSVALDSKDALSHIMKGEKIFELDMDGSKQHVLLKDLGYDYLGNNIIHADFARVDLNERVDVKAHLKFIGHAKGLNTVGALMMHPITEIELNCVVVNLPDAIEVDVSDMEVGDIIHASDVKLPLDTMKLVTDEDAIIAQIVLKAISTDGDGEASAVSAEGAEPEVITEKKEDSE